MPAKTGSLTQPSHERQLMQIAAKESSLYSHESLAALTAYALYWLHEWRLRRTIEAVAVLSWRLFPEKFGMIGFAEFPDAFRTNRSILQGQPKYRNLLTGTATKGFSLNTRGMEVARTLSLRIGVPENETGEKLGIPPSATAAVGVKARSVEPEREIHRLRAHRLFSRWKAGEMSEIDLIHLHSLLDIFDHTPSRIREKRMRDLESAAVDVNDADVQRFLLAVRQQFPLVFA